MGACGALDRGFKSHSRPLIFLLLLIRAWLELLWLLSPRIRRKKRLCDLPLLPECVDAAINYLRQRRRFKFREVNSELGLAAYPGEGFLHRRRWKPQNFGLLLDLADPFKFADRGMLLDAFLTFMVNWRVFDSATDRKGVRFCYPKPEIVSQLEIVGTKADRMRVIYEDTQMSLIAAHGKTIANLIRCLGSSPMSFEPFVYDAQSASDS